MAAVHSRSPNVQRKENSLLQEILYDGDAGEYVIYDEEEQKSWEVIIVLPGVEVIPQDTFSELDKIETVIMADTVIRIEHCAFDACSSLSFVRLSRNLVFIRPCAFYGCYSLASIFIPPSCTEIDNFAFKGCKKLIIMSVPRHTELRRNIISDTALLHASSFKQDTWGKYENTEEVNQWIKDINNGREYALHRICCSTYENEALPISEAIYEVVREQGPQILRAKNKIGVTPLQYLTANPFLENIDEMKMLKRYILEKMGQDIVL